MLKTGFEEKSLPTILSDFGVSKILIYPLESVIAEKFQAIVYLGETNSRMKDFYDIIFLASNNRLPLICHFEENIKFRIIFAYLKIPIISSVSANMRVTFLYDTRGLSDLVYQVPSTNGPDLYY